MKNLLLLLFCFYTAISFGQNQKFPPSHDLDADTALTSLVRQLIVAAKNKDSKFIIAHLDKEVTSGFDIGDGIKAFVDNWQMKADTSKFWPYFLRALETGGARVIDPEDETGRYQVVFPYLYNFEPGLEDDYFSLGCITGQNVNLRAAPDTKAKVITKLSYDVIWYLYPENGVETQSGRNEFGEPEWYLIETYNRQFKGWVNWKYVYPTIGPRVFMYQDKSGNWLISSFVQGD